MAAVEIDLRDDDEAEVNILGGMGGDSWQIGDVLILVGDRISEAIAKELAFHWLSVEGIREGITSEQF